MYRSLAYKLNRIREKISFKRGGGQSNRCKFFWLELRNSRDIQFEYQIL